MTQSRTPVKTEDRKINFDNDKVNREVVLAFNQAAAMSHILPSLFDELHHDPTDPIGYLSIGVDESDIRIPGFNFPNGVKSGNNPIGYQSIPAGGLSGSDPYGKSFSEVAALATLTDSKWVVDVAVLQAKVKELCERSHDFDIYVSDLQERLDAVQGYLDNLQGCLERVDYDLYDMREVDPDE